MKVNCDFLPGEYKAYLLDTNVLWLSVASWGLSFALWGTMALRQSHALADLTKHVSEQDIALRTTQEDRRRQLYPQDRIRELKGKFEFIRQAMGAKDFPYLRFYQSLEDAIPVSTTTEKRKVYIKDLRREGNKLTIEGDAADWRDAREFEQKLNASQYGPPESRQPNFADVKLLNCIAIGGGKGYTFQVTATFNSET